MLYVLAAHWAVIVGLLIAMLYYRGQAKSAEAGIQAVNTADAELQAGALVRAKALAQLALAQQAEHAKDVAQASSAAGVVGMLQDPAGTGAASAVPPGRSGATPSGKIGLPVK